MSRSQSIFPRLISLAILASVSCIAEAVNPRAEGVTRVILDRAPSEATKQAIQAMFANANEIAIWHTAEEHMGRLGFNKVRAKELARIHLRVACRGTCALEYRALMQVLSAGLRQRGNCPNPVSTVIELINTETKASSSLSVTSEGQCFELGEQAYFLPAPGISKLVETLTMAMK